MICGNIVVFVVFVVLINIFMNNLHIYIYKFLNKPQKPQKPQNPHFLPHIPFRHVSWIAIQIWVWRSDRKECLTSRDDSPTRFAGAPSEREPFAQTRGNSLPDKRFLPAPKAPSPRGLRPQAVGEFTVKGIFIPSNSSTNPNLKAKILCLIPTKRKREILTSRFRFCSLFRT